MKAIDPKTKRTYEFEMKDIVFVVEQDARCMTMLKSGTIANLPREEMEEALEKFPAVRSDDFKSLVHINPDEISSCEWDEFDVTIHFENDSVLSRLSRYDFEKNVLKADEIAPKRVKVTYIKQGENVK